MKITLSKDFDFEAAQAIPNFPDGHKCRGIHGHSFLITISVTGEVNPETGVYYDHALISEVMNPLVQQLDHSFLNEISGLENPTIEVMAQWFWTRLAPQLPGLSEIIIHETPRARCVYRGD